VNTEAVEVGFLFSKLNRIVYTFAHIFLQAIKSCLSVINLR